MRRFTVAVALVVMTACSTAHATRPSLVGPCNASTFPGFSAKVWNLGRWQRGAPKPAARRAYVRRLRCAFDGERPALQRLWQLDRRRYGRYRALRLIAPFPGVGTYWAIPYAIVSCESGGSWSAYNPSGALGPYQLLGWGAPWPVHNWHDRMAHHRIAASLYAESGVSPWLASQACWG